MTPPFAPGLRGKPLPRLGGDDGPVNVPSPVTVRPPTKVPETPTTIVPDAPLSSSTPTTVAPVAAVTPAAPVVVPAKIALRITYPQIPIAAGDDIRRDSTGAPVLLRYNATGNINVSWDTAYYKQQLQTCKRLGIDPYMWLSFQMLEFPGGYGKTEFPVSPQTLNKSSVIFVRNRLIQALTTATPTPSGTVQALAMYQLGVWSQDPKAPGIILAKLREELPDFDPDACSTADKLAAQKFVDKATRMSGAEYVDLQGAASGCLVWDAAKYSGNLKRVQSEIAEVAKRYKVPLSTIPEGEPGAGLHFIDPKYKQAAFEQSFLFLKKHQEEILGAMDGGATPSASLQTFNGMGSRGYFVAGAGKETTTVNAAASPAYGATTMALMYAMQHNDEYKELRALVESVYGTDPSAYPVSTRVSAGIANDPSARFFGNDLSKLGTNAYVPEDRAPTGS